MAKPKGQQQIRVKPDDSRNMPRPKIEIGGWLHGTGTYLWLGVDGSCVGTLSGYRLYRLAKAIVRHYEADK